MRRTGKGNCSSWRTKNYFKTLTEETNVLGNRITKIKLINKEK